MRLSSGARHAVRLMVEVHRRGGGNKPVTLAEVSKVTGVTIKFLEQVVIALKSDGLLRGVCGRNGGYLLGRSADEITVGDVLDSVIGPIDLAECATDDALTEGDDVCACRLMWRLLRRRMYDVLDGHTIADLASHRWRRSIQRELVDELVVARDVRRLRRQAAPQPSAAR